MKPLHASALMIPLLAASLANAQETPRGPLRQAVFAHQLFDLGRAQKDPLAMVAAANLAATVTLEPQDLTGKITGTALPDQPDAAKAPLDATAMQTQAKAALDPDETLALLLRENNRAANIVPKSTLRAATQTLPAGQSATFTLPFDGALLAEVGMIGDGDSALTLRISDAADALLCATATATDAAACAFTPPASGFYTIEVSNPGPGTNTYILLSN